MKKEKDIVLCKSVTRMRPYIYDEETDKYYIAGSIETASHENWWEDKDGNPIDTPAKFVEDTEL
jgi:hypothetical protein